MPDLSPVVPTGKPSAPAVCILTNLVVPGAKLMFAVESIDDIVLPLNLIPPAFVTLMFAPGIGCKLPKYVFCIPPPAHNVVPKVPL
jgi:hypothetical protein